MIGGRETQLSLAGIAGESDSSFFEGGGGVCVGRETKHRDILYPPEWESGVDVGERLFLQGKREKEE